MIDGQENRSGEIAASNHPFILPLLPDSLKDDGHLWQGGANLDAAFQY